MTNYYDLILGLIPLALLGIGGTLTVLGVSLAVAIPAAASVAIGLIAHALFVNQPEAPATGATPASSKASSE
ncbi:hypothetical protein [Halalkalicoccus sp. NIPERK01]|uniref:hypothetical protein n=1 Tax=Halalkalicoccus sp. NIPERK01 TaxID=3053469 RepID=UPI00256EE46B|nr:hypothetical protein [Halalkalicoccus sp. NIPERK01]MDL5361106.1 hypothetical protein [Halalkalicoccus sp. NIPERK01]